MEICVCYVMHSTCYNFVKIFSIDILSAAFFGKFRANLLSFDLVTKNAVVFRYPGSYTLSSCALRFQAGTKMCTP